MYSKEIDCGSWGWYFDDDSKLLSNVPEFLRVLVGISLCYGINISAHGVTKENTVSDQDVNVVVEKVLTSIENFEGNLLQKAISRNFYSTKFCSKNLPSVLYVEDSQCIKRILYNDFYSVFFCTLNKGRLRSIFYNLRSDIFIQEGNAELLIYANITRFNSYINKLHGLMKNFNASLFDCTTPKIDTSIRLNKEGYFCYEGECLFYEDVEELLPIELKYIPPKVVDKFFHGDS